VTALKLFVRGTDKAWPLPIACVSGAGPRADTGHIAAFLIRVIAPIAVAAR